MNHSKYSLEYYQQCLIDYRDFFKKHKLSDAEARQQFPKINQLLDDLDMMETMDITSSFENERKVAHPHIRLTEGAWGEQSYRIKDGYKFEDLNQEERSLLKRGYLNRGKHRKNK